MAISNRSYSKRKASLFLNLNINSLITKINEISFTATQLNASIIGTSESKIDSSILNSELDAEEYDLIRLIYSRRGGRVARCIRKYLSDNHKSSFYRKTERIF